MTTQTKALRDMNCADRKAKKAMRLVQEIPTSENLQAANKAVAKFENTVTIYTEMSR